MGTIRPGVLERAHELVGIDQPTRRLAPAQQRLDADQALGPQRHDRLVVEAELAVLERPPQPSLGSGGGDLVAHRAVEQGAAAGSDLLGLVQRGVSVAEDLVGSRATLLGDGHADVGREAHLGVAHLERGLDERQHRLGDAFGRQRRRHVGTEQHELVAAVADGAVVGPDRLDQPGRHRDEELIAERGAMGVVDLLETLEVDEQDRDPSVAASSQLEHLVEAVAQEAPVGQSGEPVVVGEAVQRGPRLLGVAIAPHGVDAGADRDHDEHREQAAALLPADVVGPLAEVPEQTGQIRGSRSRRRLRPRSTPGRDRRAPVRRRPGADPAPAHGRSCGSRASRRWGFRMVVAP